MLDCKPQSDRLLGGGSERSAPHACGKLIVFRQGR
jgi:hypothetical protein